MEDIQSLADDRKVHLEKVGISKFRLPIMILEQGVGYQHVSAESGLFVEVPSSVRGTHLSRFVEVLHEWADRPVAHDDIRDLLNETRLRAGSLSAEADLSFLYFISKRAPVSGRAGVVDYQCRFFGRVDDDGFRFEIDVRVPVATLCPCSKAISEYGAHNQRAEVHVVIEPEREGFVWLEDLIALVEAQASCPVFSVLKRDDERWVTERAYENPKFVEDVVRDTVLALDALAGVRSFSVRCESVESIHNHNAVASVGWTPSRAAAEDHDLVTVDALTP